MNFHPTALIDVRAKVPASCTVGAYCVIGPEVELELVLLAELLQAARSNAVAATPARTTGYRMGMGPMRPSRAFTTTYLPRWRNLTLPRARPQGRGLPGD